MDFSEVFDRRPEEVARAARAAAEVAGTDHETVLDLAFRRYVAGEAMDNDADAELLLAFEAAVKAQEMMVDEARIMRAMRRRDEEVNDDG